MKGRHLVTAYDYYGTDCRWPGYMILVGDSASNVMAGNVTTLLLHRSDDLSWKSVVRAVKCYGSG